MKRIALGALLVLAATGAATTTPKAQTIASLCKQAVANTPAGARARAMLVNRAAGQADAVVAAVKHDDDEVRVSAAWALRHVADRSKAVPALTAALRDENFSVARAAAVSLNQRFAAAEKPLRDLMADADPAMRWRGMINVDHLAGQLAPASRDRLLADVAKLATSDPAEYVRADAAWVLRHGAGPDVAEALVRCLARPDGRTRYHARVGLRGRRIAAELMDPDSPTRRRAIETLLETLRTHKGRPHATSGAVEYLTQLLTRPLGADADKWEALLTKAEQLK